MSAATSASAPAGGGELRLTPRGRAVVWVVAVVLAGGAVFTGGRAVADAPATAVPVDTYTVGSGETLWSIATGFTSPGQDVRETVDHLSELNNMVSTGLVAGQQILVPAGD